MSVREITLAPAPVDVRSHVEAGVARWPDASAAALGFLSAALLASFDGGFFPTTWGWTALAFSWSAALALVLRAKIHVRAVELALPALLIALLAWVVASLAWTASTTKTVLEAERLLVYVSAALAAVFIVRSRSYAALVAGLWGGVSLVSVYALATRLFPERLGVFDVLAANRLSEPLGYWNALGLFAAMGALLALGLAARGRSALLRSVAAGSTMVLIPTLYLTFSRGAWIALVMGLVAALLVDRRRLQLLSALVVVAPWPAAAIWIAAHSEGLTSVAPSLSLAARDGRRLAWVVAALTAVAAVAMFVFARAERRVSVPRGARVAFGAALLAAAVATVALVTVRYGSPPALAARAYDAVAAPPPRLEGDLNRRLFNLSSNARVFSWRVAWRSAGDHPTLGTGAGTYEQDWLRHRPVPGKVVDAHSLYLETLAELGPVGLALLVAALALPLAGAVKARHHPLVPAALGAYVAYLAHAAVDWDWEMPAVTVAAILCGVAVLVAGRRDGKPRAVSEQARLGVVVVVVAVSGLALVTLVGNSALSAAEAAARNDPRRAEAEARKATRWAFWSSEPWRVLAQAQLATGDSAAARASLRTGIAKEPRDWSLWYELALASDDRKEVRQALDRAARLNPRSVEIAQLREALGFRPDGARANARRS